MRKGVDFKGIFKGRMWMIRASEGGRLVEDLSKPGRT
jgi:hypothetical protein